MSTEFETDEKSMKRYLFFLSGQMVSLLGSSIVQFAIIWWVTITATMTPAYAERVGLVLGIASFLGFAPMVITSLFAGVLIDRWNRKIVIGIVDSLEALGAGVLAILFFTGNATIPAVLVILGLRSVMQGFHNPAIQAIIPILVPREKLTQVNSIQYLSSGLIFLVGPVIGALLIETFGLDSIGLLQMIDVATFVVAVIPLALIHIPDITKKKRAAKETTFRQEFSEGISFIKNTKGLLTLLTTFTVVNLMTTPVFVLLPLIVILPIYFNAGATLLGLSMAFTSAGSIIASLVLTRRTLFKKNVKGVVVGQVLIYISVFLLVIAAVLQNVYVLYFSLLLSGMTGPMANIHSQTIWQSVVPQELQGRVMSVRMTIAWILNPVSMLAAGILADVYGPVNILLVGAIIGTFYLIFAWFMTGLQDVEKTLGLTEEEITIAS